MTVNLGQYQNVLVGSLQNAVGTTGHAGVDLMIGMLLTSMVCYVIQVVPTQIKWWCKYLYERMFPQRTITPTPVPDWKHRIRVPDTTQSDKWTKASGLGGTNHHLIIRGILGHLQQEGITTRARVQTLQLISPDDSGSLRQRYLDSVTTIFPDEIVHYRGMEFHFGRAEQNPPQKKTDTHVQSGGIEKNDSQSKESTTPSKADGGLTLEIRTNDFDQTMKLIEQCKLNEIDRVAPDKPDPRRIYRNTGQGYFQRSLFSSHKTFKSIFFTEKQPMLDVVDDFLNRRGTWDPHYERPWKLVILMHSKPGYGKTSTLKALSNMTDRHLLIFDLKHCTSDAQLSNLFLKTSIGTERGDTIIPLHRRIVVLEDLDANGCEWMISRNFERYTNTVADTMADKNNRQSRPTFSGFLNVLDGLQELTGLIVVITTNCIEKFDSALLRPGRVDLLVHLTGMTADTAIEMLEFMRRQENVTEEHKNRIRDILGGQDSELPELPPCKFQEMIQWKGSVDDVIDRLASWVKRQRHM